jgi:hypothetical protein
MKIACTVTVFYILILTYVHFYQESQRQGFSVFTDI